MAASVASLFLGTACLIALALQPTASESVVLDLEEKVRDFVRGLVETYETEVLWWDMHGENTHLIKFARKYRKCKVTVSKAAVTYGEVRNKSVNAKLVDTKWAHNEQPLHSQQMEFELRTKQVSKNFWSTERGLTYGKGPISVDIDLSVPNVGGLKLGVVDNSHWNVSLSQVKQQVHQQERESSIKQIITVPAMKSVKVEWIVTDITQEVPWSGVLTAEGCFAVWFRQKVNGHHLWFYPIGVIEDKLLKKISNAKVQFTSSGWLAGISWVKSQIRTTEYDLQAYSRKSSKTTIYDVPFYND